MFWLVALVGPKTTGKIRDYCMEKQALHAAIKNKSGTK